MKLTTLVLGVVLSMAAWCSGQEAKPFDPIAWWSRVDPSAAQAAARHWMRIESGLDRIAKDHPDLAERARALKERAGSAYSAAADVIDTHFARVDSEWRAGMDDYRKHLAKLPTPADAAEFLKEVENGLKDSVSEAAMLLAFSPRYAERPHAEIEDGFTSELSTRAQPRAHGLEMTMVLPQSWAYEEPRNERALYSRHSHAGAGDLVMMLFVSQVPPEELAQIKEQGGAKVLADPKQITDAGGTVLGTGPSKLGKDDAAWTRYILTDAGEDAAVKVLVWSIHSFHDGKYVNLQFQLLSSGKAKADLAGDEAMGTRFEHYRPLLEKIVESAAYPKAEP